MSQLGGNASPLEIEYLMSAQNAQRVQRRMRVDTSKWPEVEDAQLSSRSTGSWDSGVDINSKYSSPARGRSFNYKSTSMRGDQYSPDLQPHPSPVKLLEQCTPEYGTYQEEYINRKLALSPRPVETMRSIAGTRLSESPPTNCVFSPQQLHQGFPARRERRPEPTFPPSRLVLCRNDSLDAGGRPSTSTSDTTSTRSSDLDRPDGEDEYGSMSEPEEGTQSRPLSSKSSTRSKSKANVGPTPASVWNSKLLPWFLAHFDDILGHHNTGAVDFLMLGKEIPTICITTNNPERVDRGPLDRKLQELSRKTLLHFRVEILTGMPSRTAHTRNGSIDTSSSRSSRNQGQSPQGCPWPAANPSYEKTPTPGCSIGVANTAHTASFGGFIEIRQHDDDDWHLYGLTCHHLLEDRTARKSSNRGVVNGLLNDKPYVITQPSVAHLEHEKYRLHRYLKTINALLATIKDDYSPLANARRPYLEYEQRSLGAALASIPTSCVFGQISLSSGYGTFFDSHQIQMDWALISDISLDRISTPLNLLPGGNTSTIFYHPHTSIPTHADATLFDSVRMLYEETASLHTSPPEPLCRIHGKGAVSGSQCGYLSGTQSIVRFSPHDSPSLEHSFAPYGALGTSGDSGAWIFSDFGAAVGQIIGRNESSNLTYFTPMHCVLADIQRRTQCAEVRVAREEHTESMKRLHRFSEMSLRSRDSGIDINSGRSSCISSGRGSRPISGEMAIDFASIERGRMLEGLSQVAAGYGRARSGSGGADAGAVRMERERSGSGGSSLGREYKEPVRMERSGSMSSTLAILGGRAGSGSAGSGLGRESDRLPELPMKERLVVTRKQSRCDLNKPLPRPRLQGDGTKF